MIANHVVNKVHLYGFFVCVFLFNCLSWAFTSTEHISVGVNGLLRTIRTIFLEALLNPEQVTVPVQ